jgi:hypothetical protein
VYILCGYQWFSLKKVSYSTFIFIFVFILCLFVCWQFSSSLNCDYILQWNSWIASKIPVYVLMRPCHRRSKRVLFYFLSIAFSIADYFIIFHIIYLRSCKCLRWCMLYNTNVFFSKISHLGGTVSTADWTIKQLYFLTRIGASLSLFFCGMSSFKHNKQFLIGILVWMN